MAKKTVLVTGITGFIAKQVALEFLKADYHVRGTVRSAAKADLVRQTLSAHTEVSNLDFAEADLLSDNGWDRTVRGCDCVAHVASPVPLAQPKDENELIKPAVEGTLRVLRAAHNAGVKRFVQTSSVAAIAAGHDKTVLDENDWSDLGHPRSSPYVKSKTLAERAARNFVASETDNMHYASINPSYVFGPPLDEDISASLEVISMLLSGKYPAAPRLHFSAVDVRDVARMHVLAMETNQPSGGRYIAASDSLWIIEMARVLRKALGNDARKAPKFVLPDFVVRIVAKFDPAVRSVIQDLGRERRFDTTQTRKALGIEFIRAEEAVVATGRKLIKLGLV